MGSLWHGRVDGRSFPELIPPSPSGDEEQRLKRRRDISHGKYYRLKKQLNCSIEALEQIQALSKSSDAVEEEEEEEEEETEADEQEETEADEQEEAEADEQEETEADEEGETEADEQGITDEPTSDAANGEAGGEVSSDRIG
jgi:hypothetical protein